MLLNPLSCNLLGCIYSGIIFSNNFDKIPNVTGAELKHNKNMQISIISPLNPIYNLKYIYIKK